MALWLAAQPLVLASKSEARRAILQAAGIPVDVVAADIDERGIEQTAASRDPKEIAALLAREKASAVAARLPGRIVVGADQTLALGKKSFFKPTDRDEARGQLRALRGRTHELHSALAMIGDGMIRFECRDSARLTMRDFSDAFLDAYLDNLGAAVTVSVGGYQLEKTGIQLFERIEGDHFTILGMPLLPFLRALRREGLLLG